VLGAVRSDITGTFAIDALAEAMPDMARARMAESTKALSLGSRLKRLAFTVPAKAAAPERPLDRLVRLQRADGSWELSSELAKILGRRMKDLERVLAGATGAGEEARRAWATALAVAWLEKQAPESRDEWRLLAEKARTWLEGSRARLASGEDWLTSAKRLLG
jgi:hypothetical protein